MATTYSIEVVDDYGHKARITITGHWECVNKLVSNRILSRVVDEDAANPLWLSDFEDGED